MPEATALHNTRSLPSSGPSGVGFRGAPQLSVVTDVILKTGLFSCSFILE